MAVDEPESQSPSKSAEKEESHVEIPPVDSDVVMTTSEEPIAGTAAEDTPNSAPDRPKATAANPSESGTAADNQGRESEAAEKSDDGKPAESTSRKRELEDQLEEARKKCKEGEKPVINDEELIEFPAVERYMGHVVYSGCRFPRYAAAVPENLELFLLPPFTSRECNALLDVRIPSDYLNMQNLAVKHRAVWGTDIYADDSDVLAGKLGLF